MVPHDWPRSKKGFSQIENTRRTAFFASLDIGTLATANAGGPDDVPEEAFDYASLLEGSIENRIFVRKSDLEALIDAGKDPTAEHVETDEVVRDPAVRAEFLAQHGYDEIPEGYEVHHIQPVSEGGRSRSDRTGGVLGVARLRRASRRLRSAPHSSRFRREHRQRRAHDSRFGSRARRDHGRAPRVLRLESLGSIRAKVSQWSSPRNYRFFLKEPAKQDV